MPIKLFGAFELYGIKEDKMKNWEDRFSSFGVWTLCGRSALPSLRA